MIEKFYGLKGYQVLKNDKDYQSALDKRVRRLEVWKSQVKARKLKKELNECIKTTKEAHQEAEKLRKARNELIASFPDYENISQALDLVIATQDASAKQDSRFIEMSKYKEMQATMEIQKQAKSKAREIYLFALEGNVKDDSSLLDLIQTKVGDVDPVLLRQIKIETMLMHSGFGVFESTVTSCPHIINLVDLHRGLLYMGIITIEGDKIDLKEQQEHIIKLIQNGVGLIPIFGNIYDGIQAITEGVRATQTFRGIDKPDIVNKAEYVELFITGYMEALRWWKTVAHAYTFATLDTVRFFKSYNRSNAG